MLWVKRTGQAESIHTVVEEKQSVFATVKIPEASSVVRTSEDFQNTFVYTTEDIVDHVGLCVHFQAYCLFFHCSLQCGFIG